MMRRSVLLLFSLVLYTTAIKVPIDNGESGESSNSDSEQSSNQTLFKPIYYTSDESVDSYLIPPDPHRPDEVLPDSVVTPATYLLPPAENVPSNYYFAPAQTDDQNDWYPITQQAPPNPQIQLLPPKQEHSIVPIFLTDDNQSEPIRIIQNPRTGKILGDRTKIRIPSVNLEPPAEDAPNDYVIQTPSEELELPAEEIDHPYLPIQDNHRKPQKSHLRKFNKKPTKLYPKKFNGGGFKPVPIPIGQFAEDSSLEVPKAKPANYFKPLPSTEDDLPSSEEKRIHLYKQAEPKRKFKDSEESQEQYDVASDKYVPVLPTEQDTSETYGYHERNVYPPQYHPAAPYRGAPVPIRVGPNGAPVPLRVAPNGAPVPLIVGPHGTPVPLRVAPHGTPVPLRVAPDTPAPRPESTQPQAPPAPDDRTEFRMHGMKGPHSYQFGYDTGKGKNRQFRYEERDNDGLVKGHYGYMDRHGKLRVVNYSAHPELGFQAHPQEEETKE